MKLKVAVTGATGFVGTWLCALLERLGHDVRPIGRTGSAPFDFAGANAVVHLAALVHRRGATHQSFERARICTYALMPQGRLSPL